MKNLEIKTLFACLIILIYGCNTDSKIPFEENLAEELQCAIYCYLNPLEVLSENIGMGFSLAYEYSLAHPEDPKGLYLCGIGALNIQSMDYAQLYFEEAIKNGLPKRQKELAKNYMKALKIFRKSDQPETIRIYFEHSSPFDQDLRNLKIDLRKYDKDIYYHYSLVSGKHHRVNSHRIFLQEILNEPDRALQRLYLPVIVYYDYDNIIDLTEASNVLGKLEKNLEDQGQTVFVRDAIKKHINMIVFFMKKKCNNRNINLDAVKAYYLLEEWFLDPDPKTFTFVSAGDNSLKNRINYFFTGKEAHHVYSTIVDTKNIYGYSKYEKYYKIYNELVDLWDKIKHEKASGLYTYFYVTNKIENLDTSFPEESFRFKALLDWLLQYSLSSEPLKQKLYEDKVKEQFKDLKYELDLEAQFKDIKC